MNLLRKFLSAALFLLALTPAMAQMPGTAYFMESAATRHHANPALLEGRPYFSLLLGDIGLGSTGNFGASTFIYDIDPALNHSRDKGTFLHPEVSRERFLDKLGTSDKRLGVDFRYNLLTVGFRALGGTNLLELNLRSNSDVKLPNDLFRFAKAPGLQNSYDFNNWGARSHTYAEIALGHARKVTPDLTLGAKAKFLVGLTYLDLSIDRLHVQLDNNRWLVSGAAKGSFSSPMTAFSADSDGKINDLNNSREGAIGAGLALDLGATYRLPVLPELTLSASLTDLGFINHSSAQRLATLPNAQWSFEGFQNIYAGSGSAGSKDLSDEWDQLHDDLSDMLSIYEAPGKGKVAPLAATLNLGGEYRLPAYDRLSFGLLLTQRMAGKFSRTQIMLASCIRPVKAIEAGVNTTLSNTGMTFGGMLTLNAPFAQLYIGADRFFGKLSDEGIPVNSSNGHLNFGIVFPL